METLLNVVLAMLVKAIYGVVGGIGAYLLVQVRLYIKNKRQSEVIKIGATTYNYYTTVATRIFLQCEQLFKLIPGSGNLKKTMFDKFLLVKFPKLTQLELDHFRDAAAGEFNSQVNALLAPAYDPVKDVADVKIVAEIKENTTPKTTETATGVVINPIDGQPIA